MTAGERLSSAAMPAVMYATGAAACAIAPTARPRRSMTAVKGMGRARGGRSAAPVRTAEAMRKAATRP